MPDYFIIVVTLSINPGQCCCMLPLSQDHTCRKQSEFFTQVYLHTVQIRAVVVVQYYYICEYILGLMDPEIQWVKFLSLAMAPAGCSHFYHFILW